MASELPKIYDPKSVEQDVYARWEKAGAFDAEPGDARRPYSIVIPPPNVTAPLHIGHALNNALQDVLIRWRRMQQCATLWMPGTDHAGIATQTVVEKRILAGEGKRRTDFARQDFVTRIQAWKDEYEATILHQLKQMGCSCDWRRTRFTMDAMCAKAVRAAFFKLFSDGLIYRGKRLVNWDVATQTVLADDEVEYEEVQGNFWYMRYPLTEPVALPSSTAILAVSTTGILPVEELPVAKRDGARLPHWEKTGATYAVTFRLADSLPSHVAESWKREREEIEQRAKSQNSQLTWQDRKELQHLHDARVDSILNNGQGSCHFNNLQVATIVQNALKHFHGERYELIAWAVMPNHVHVVVRPLGTHRLQDILHSWKSFTANQANKILDRTGQFWQEEYYDHLIRDEEDFGHAVQYVITNPGRANLRNWPWVGMQKTQGQDGPGTHGQDARATVITHITVATTRPETMLGDTAVAMNPSDPRAKFLVGKKVRLPIVGREIPIIADEHVVLPDPSSEDEKAKFSTGFLKVTPAHDPDDYAIGQRHNLPVINVMAPDGSISDKHGWTDWNEIKNPDVENIIGMDRFEAREAVVEFFRTEGLLEEVRPYTHQVGHSYRSHVPIEPYLSDQWYIAVKKPIANSQLPIGGTKEPTAGAADAGATADLGATPMGAMAASCAAMPTETKDGVTYIQGTDVPVNSLAGLALAPLLDGRLKFTPDRYAFNYRTWLENLRDWPISRQLWWGHQIPVWTVSLNVTISTGVGKPSPAECTRKTIEALQALADAEGCHGDFTVRVKEEGLSIYVCTANENADKLLGRLKEFLSELSVNRLNEGSDVNTWANLPKSFSKGPALSAACQLANLVYTLDRDPDVLDTWFSSSLWPISTMGWPEQTPELKKFYPTDVLVTAREIITLWVSRMVMMGQYCAGDIPFSDVFIHAMIQDGEGRKMSKSLGNGIDPLDVIDSHGADALRFTLVSMTTQTQDVRMPVEPLKLPDGRQTLTSPKFDIGRNFCNKLWNASRFAMMNLQGYGPWSAVRPAENLADAWILSRLNTTIRDVTLALEEFRFNEVANTLYHFMWDDFCDWYLEIAKSRINAGENQPKAIVAHVLDVLLRMLHPVTPFVTEAIWAYLREVAPYRGPGDEPAEPLLVRANWPRADAARISPDVEKDFASLQEIIRQVRNVRTQHNVPPGRKVDVLVEASDRPGRLIADNVALVKSQAQLGDLTLRPAATPDQSATVPGDAAVLNVEGVKLYVLGIIDRAAELARLQKQAATLTGGIRSIEGKLGNDNFLAKAPPALVERERQRLEGLRAELAAIQTALDALK